MEKKVLQGVTSDNQILKTITGGQPTILLVANSAWYIYNFRMGLIDALKKAGFAIVVVTPIDDFIRFLHENDSIRFIPLKKLVRKGVNPFQDLMLYRELLKIYRRVEPDIVLHFTIKPNLYGTLAARWLGIKSVSVVPGLGYTFTEKSGFKKIIEQAYKMVLPYNEKVIFENQSDCDYFVQQQLLTPEKAVAFKGCGVDTRFFHPKKKKQADDITRFLFMGRLIKEKGIYEFIKAAEKTHQKYPDTEFWIIGHIDADNPSAISQDEFLKWIEHPAIHYLGFNHDVRKIIKDVDAVVLPSYYPEGVPRVLQEGMAMEKPIITTDCDGCREAVDDGRNGFLVKPADVQNLHLAFNKLVKMSDQDRMVMGKLGRQKAIAEFEERISIGLYLGILIESVGFGSKIKV